MTTFDTRSLMQPFGRARRGRVTTWRRVPVAPVMRLSRRHPPELWEVPGETYPGETVLEDLPLAEGDPDESGRIIARFVTVRLLLLALSGELFGEEMVGARTAAAEYAEVIVAGDAERLGLEALIAAAGPVATPRLLRLLGDAAAAASARGHRAGAWALLRVAWGAARTREWWHDAAGIAEAVAADASKFGGARSARLWRRRARVLMRRIELSAEVDGF
jgi:hypothetical protein